MFTKLRLKPTGEQTLNFQRLLFLQHSKAGFPSTILAKTRGHKNKKKIQIWQNESKKPAPETARLISS